VNKVWSLAVASLRADANKLSRNASNYLALSGWLKALSVPLKHGLPG